MRVIAKGTLQAFWESHQDAKGPLSAWYYEAKRSDWASPQKIKERYPTASIIDDKRVVFNIGGNKYRLVTAIHYAAKIVYVRWVGTHAQYDDIDVKEV